jgi:DnaK suppressor protein
MTKTEVDRFQAILTAKVAELERLVRRRDGITVERSADQLEEIRALAVCNLDRDFNQLRNVRAALGIEDFGKRSPASCNWFSRDCSLRSF